MVEIHLFSKFSGLQTLFCPRNHASSGCFIGQKGQNLSM